MEKGRVLTGARAMLMLKGVKVGYATSVSIGETITYEALKLLDNIQTEEHVPTDYDVSFEADFVRIVGETVKSLGYFPAQGTSPEQHLKNILLQGEMTAVVMDNKTKVPIATVEQVKVASKNFQINARGVVGEHLTFVAVRAKDESEV